MTGEGRARSVLVCGGAGFIGSHVVETLVEDGCAVTVIDPCHPRTGGRPRNLAAVEGRIRWLRQPLEVLPDLDSVVAGADLVVDAMGFSHHAEGMREPALDHQLNYAIHLPLIEAVNRAPRPLLYLGSRGQYGRARGMVDEDHPQVPLDPQGIHKAAVESMIRIYAQRHDWPAVSLRVGNCFGPRQPMGEDPGLLAGFFKDVLAGREVVIFGPEDRRQHLLFVVDLAHLVVRLAHTPPTGFSAFNVVGPALPLRAIVETLIRLAGRGRFSFRPFPPEIAAIHGGEATVSEARLQALIAHEHTSLEAALRATLDALGAGGGGAEAR